MWQTVMSFFTFAFVYACKTPPLPMYESRMGGIQWGSVIIVCPPCCRSIFEIFNDKSGFEDRGQLWQFRWIWQVCKKSRADSIKKTLEPFFHSYSVSKQCIVLTHKRKLVQTIIRLNWSFLYLWKLRSICQSTAFWIWQQRDVDTLC